MSRSGYSEDCAGWELILWRGQVRSAIRGKRGQAFLRDLATALDSMPQRRLIAHELEVDGEVCAIGSLGAQRGIDMSRLDPGDHDQIAATFDIASQLVQEIEYINDYSPRHDEPPEGRWLRMRKWVQENLKREVTA